MTDQEWEEFLAQRMKTHTLSSVLLIDDNEGHMLIEASDGGDHGAI